MSSHMASSGALSDARGCRFPSPLRGGAGVVRLGETVREAGAVSACELFIRVESFDIPTPTPSPPRKEEGRARLILHAIPFPRLRLAGDDTHHVMAGPVPAISIGKAQCPQDRDARHKAGHDRSVSFPAGA